MAIHSFTLRIDGDVWAKGDELYEAGCSDATFRTVDGVHYADFDRDSELLIQAVTSAMLDVSSVPGLKVRGEVETSDGIPNIDG